MIINCLQTGGLEIQAVDANGYKSISNGMTIKIVGHPWWTQGEKAVRARYALVLVFETLRLNNWSLLTSMDISRNLNDKSAFVFVRSAMPVAPPSYQSNVFVNYLGVG